MTPCFVTTSSENSGLFTLKVMTMGGGQSPACGVAGGPTRGGHGSCGLSLWWASLSWAPLSCALPAQLQPDCDPIQRGKYGANFIRLE